MYKCTHSHLFLVWFCAVKTNDRVHHLPIFAGSSINNEGSNFFFQSYTKCTCEYVNSDMLYLGLPLSSKLTLLICGLSAHRELQYHPHLFFFLLSSLKDIDLF